MNRIRNVGLGFVASLVLTACGGGGSVDTSGTAEGLWIGTTNTARNVAGLIFSDGSYWVLYTAINNPNVIAGLIQGTGTSANSVFQSSTARDYNLEDPSISDDLLPDLVRPRLRVRG